MFEILLAEWHLSPEYIFNNWTDELLGMMCDKFTERREREKRAARGYSTEPAKSSDKSLFARAKSFIKVVRHGN